MYLADLPKEHPDRNIPLGGFFHRWYCWKGQDITIPKEERDENWQWWGATPWKRIPHADEVRNPMPVATMTYNELEEAGGFWTKTSDWSKEKLPAREMGELERD